MISSGLDTLEVAKRLKDAGFGEAQAEALTGVLRDTREFDLSRLVTRDDLRSELQALESRLTIRVGGMIVVATGILLAAKFFG